MDEISLRQSIADNISRLRRENNMTQAELAEKINYSDKSVSKWERGDGAPDVFVLASLAELFGVSINDIVYSPDDAIMAGRSIQPGYLKKQKFKKHLLITMLSVGLVWFVAAVIFVILKLIFPTGSGVWLTFVYACPVAFIVLLIFSKLWFNPIPSFISVSAISWTIVISVHLTVKLFAKTTLGNIYLVYIVASIFQVLVILWFILMDRVWWQSMIAEMRAKKSKREDH